MSCETSTAPSLSWSAFSPDPPSSAAPDDLISSAGHRIGPGEIEECLVRHPAVTLAAVIGIPDEVRGEAIKAFVLATAPSEALAAELKALVRERLAAYEVPREIEFVDELPLTTSGMIRRNELRELEQGPS